MPLTIAQPRSKRFDELAEIAWANKEPKTGDGDLWGMGWTKGTLVSNVCNKAHTEQIVAYFRARAPIGVTVQGFAQATRLPRPTVQRYFIDLRQRGVLTCRRSATGGKWFLTEDDK